MLYELRRYDVMSGKLPALVDRFGSFTVSRWKDHDDPAACRVLSDEVKRAS